MFVCLSVTSLRFKYTGLCIVYIPFGMCCSGCHRSMEIKVEDSEDRRRHQNESRCMEDG